jgi:hypothetical protein
MLSRLTKCLQDVDLDFIYPMSVTSRTVLKVFFSAFVYFGHQDGGDATTSTTPLLSLCQLQFVLRSDPNREIPTISSYVFNIYLRMQKSFLHVALHIMFGGN